MLRRRFVLRLTSCLVILSLLLSNASLALAQDGPVFLPLITQNNGRVPVTATDLLFRVQVRVATPSQARKLAQPGIVVLAQGEESATLLVDSVQLEYLARAGFEPRGADALEALVQEQGPDWLSPSLQPLMQEAGAARQRMDATVGRAGEQMEALAGVRAAMSVLAGEQRAALNELTELDNDGDGLTNTEESWWCTDPLNPDSNGSGYTDSETARALLDYALPRQQRHAYGPPFRLWPPFVDTIAPGATPTCLLDADHDSIPDLLEQYVIGTSPRDESTDGDKFDDGQEFFGITYCPGAPNSCGYGSYPRTQDFSFITDRLPSWVRPPGDDPFVAAYPVIEFNVDPATIRVVTKEIKTLERTITQGEEIATGYAETKGNSTTVGTVDTNTRSGWQEHSSSVGGIEPAHRSTTESLLEAPPYTRPSQPMNTLAESMIGELGVTQSGIEVVFDAVTHVPNDIRTAILSALSNEPGLIPDVPSLTVTDLHNEIGWSRVVLVPSAIVNSGWQVPMSDLDIIEIAVVEDPSTQSIYRGYVRGSEGYSQFVESNSSSTSLPTLRVQQCESLLFPWGNNQEWRKTVGWHDPGNAIDFQPTSSASWDVLAAGSGRITRFCDDGYQNSFQIETANGTIRYLHLDANSVPNGLLGSPEPRVQQGQYLGTLYNGTQLTTFNKYCRQSDDSLNYSTKCGCGTNYHLHFELPKNASIDGRTAESVASAPYETAVFKSSNRRISGGSAIGQAYACYAPIVPTPGPMPTISASQKSTKYNESIGRSESSWWGWGCGVNMSCLPAVGGRSNASIDTQLGGRSSGLLDYSSSVSAGACGGSGGQTDGGSLGVGGGGSGLAYNDSGGGAFTALRTWSETTTTGEGWSSSHSDLRTETEYAEITRSTVNTLVSSESWATATTADPTDAARMTFNYTLANTGSDLAVQVTGLRANILIGDLPVITVSLPDRTNIEPSKAKGPFSSDSIPLTLDQLAAIDNGAPIRVVLTDYGYNDSLYDTNAWGRSVLFHVDDGIEDGDETFDTYLIVTNLVPGETYQETLARYFPVTVFEGGSADPRTGTLTGITTPEYDANGEITSWIARPVNDRAWWELALSTGGETAGVKNFKDMPAKARSYVYLRYMVDTDGDGYTDRTERDAGTDRNDPDIHPHPLLVAAKHTKVSGNTATVQLALQNLGDFDASSVEIWAIAPDDSITIDDNLVGGGGRVRAGRRVVLGARIGAPDLTAWATSTAKPAPGGQFDGAAATTFQFRADTAGTVGSSAGLQVSWSSDGATWTPLNVGSGYTAWTPLALRDGVSIAFSPGAIAAGETFRFETALPIDTFSYTINRTPHTPPLLVVAYNDAQGNHKFVADVETSQIQEDLTRYYAEMRRGLQLDVRQAAPFQAGSNRAWLTLYNPSGRAISGAKLAVEIVTPGGALAKEYVLPDQTFQPGPNVVTLDWNTADFSPAFDPTAEYHVLAYAADRQGTIIEHTLRSLDTLAEDALPTAMLGDTTWDFGTVTQGEMLERTFALANVGFADLQSRALLPAGLTMTSSTSRRSLPGDIADFTLTLDTRTLPTGPYSDTVTLRTSDPANPVYTVQVNGVIVASANGLFAAPLADQPLTYRVALTTAVAANNWTPVQIAAGWAQNPIRPLYLLAEDGSELGPAIDVSPPIDTGWMSLVQNGGFESGNMASWQVTAGSNWEVATGARDTGWLSVLQNGGFETGNFSGWQVGSGNWMVEITEDCNSCPYSVPKKGGTNPGWIAQEVDVSQYRSLIGIGAGSADSYGHARTSDGGDKGRVVIQYKAGSTVLASYDSGFRAPGHYWERMQDTRTIPAGTDRIRFEFWLDTDGDGDCKIDTGVMKIRMNYADPAYSGSFKLRRTSGSNPGSITQDISLATWREWVDRGAGRISAGAWLKSIDPNDQLRIQYTFLGSGQVIAASGYDSWWVRPADWSQYQAEQSIPVGADTVRITLSSTGDADAVFDDVFANVRFQYNNYVIEPTTADGLQQKMLVKEAMEAGSTFLIQNGLVAEAAGPGWHEITLQIPRLLYDSFTLDVGSITSGLAGANFALDVGGDGTTEWSKAFTDSLPFWQSSPELATVVNDYLGSLGAFSGEVALLPIAIQIDAAGKVVLSNVRIQRSAANDTDLGTTALTSDESDILTEGAVITLAAFVTNWGSLNVSPFTVSYYATGLSSTVTYIGSVLVSDIPAESTRPASLAWNTLGFTGPVTVTAVVDPYNRTAETNETNNQTSANLTILTRPDLSVPAITLSDPAPLAGQPVSVTVTLRNGGQTASGAQTVALYHGAPDAGGAALGSSSLAVSAVATHTATFAWTPAAPGHYRLAARADQTGIVNESYEGNNTLWLDAYVGLASPVLLDSGAASEPAYTPAAGFGVVDEGEPDAARTCDAETQRSAPDGKLVYRFDHLQPGHYYHLDIHMAECDNAGRRQTVYVDGYPVSAVQDLGDGQPHRLSLLLDPALYADRTMRVTIEAEGIDDAIVDQVHLHDIDYRYADAGGGRDPQCTPAGSYGWLDGTPNITWGTLPYRSLRIDTADNTLRYCFKTLDPARRYNVHFAFWQSTGTARNQMLLIDGVDTGLAGNVASGVRSDVTVPVPLSAYQDDGRIDVSIVRTNASTGAMTNLVILEEETLAPAGPDTPPGSAVLALSPSTASTGLGQTASMDIWVRTAQPVDGAAAYLNFDPNYLQVVSITPGSSLPTVLQRNIDNGLGRIDFAAGALTGAALDSDFLLATVVFTGVATTPGAPVTFAAVQPRHSDVTYGGDSVFHHSEDGSVIVTENVAALAGHVAPPGRPAAPDPRWRVPLRVTLSTAVDGPPVATFTPTSDESGNFVVSGISPGVYRVSVKMANSLRATVVVTFTVTQTSVDFGALRGGDANDDNYVTLVDFSILRTTFGKCQGDTGYDARADFNGDGCVLLVDFSILRMNFGTGGDAVRSSAEAVTPPAPTAVLKAASALQEVAVGEVFSVPLQVDAGEISVDGAAAYLTFDPAVVQVAGVTVGSALPDLLLSEFDNQAGTIRFAAGGLEQTASDIFDLANVELRAVGQGDARLRFEQGSPSQSDVTAAGVSVLATVVDAAVTVYAPDEAEDVPATIFLPIVGGRE